MAASHGRRAQRGRSRAAGQRHRRRGPRARSESAAGRRENHGPSRRGNSQHRPLHRGPLRRHSPPSRCCSPRWEFTVSCPSPSPNALTRSACAWPSARRPRGVLTLILREGIILAVAGIAVGALGAWFVGRTGRTLVVGVPSTIDPAAFAAVALLLLTSAVAACYIPARRATQVDP